MQPSLFTVHGAHEVSEAPWPEPWLVYTGDKENAERRARLQWAEAAECPACATAAAAARAALWPKQPHALNETRPMQASAGLSPGLESAKIGSPHALKQANPATAGSTSSCCSQKCAQHRKEESKF